jgi:hypothetical protein
MAAQRGKQRPRPGSEHPDRGPRPGSQPAGGRPGSTRPDGRESGGPGASNPRRRPSSRPSPPRIPNRTNWSAGLEGIARWVLAVPARSGGPVRAAGRWVVVVATGEAGRRLARAVALTAVLAVLVTALYDRAEGPSAAAQPAVDAPAGRAGPAPGDRGATARRKDPGQPGGLRGRERPSPVGERPAAVAAAWYATRQGVPRAKVKPLQQDRLSAKEVRVLVLADHGRGRMRTALVRVRLGRDGWRVR